MKKKTSFKFLKILSIFCIVLILISFASLSVSAESALFSTSLLNFDTLTSSNVTLSSISGGFTRVTSAAGNTGFALFYKVPTSYFYVGQNYRLSFQFRPVGYRNTCQLYLMDSSDPTLATTDITIFDIDSSDYTASQISTLNFSFQIPDSFNGRSMYLVFQFNAPTQVSHADFSALKFYDLNPIPSDWESPTYNIEDPDLAEPVSNFQLASEELLDIDWFGPDSPIYRGTRGFMSLFNIFFSAVSNSQYDYLNVIPYLITFALFIGLLGLILNTVSHIAIDNNDYASYEKKRNSREYFKHIYNSKFPKE